MSESTTYKNDAFVSYSEADQEWVRNELLPRLRNTGLRVIDQRDFAIGVPKLVNSEWAVDNSRHTLIVMTPEWVASESAEFEVLLISSQDLAARRRRLIPLLLRPCQLPGRISMLTYADFTNPATREAEMGRLLRDLGTTPEAVADSQRAAELTQLSTSVYLPKPDNFSSPKPLAEPTNLQRDHIIWTALIATLAGLMGNVVAGYVVPVFAGREWLAVAIFLIVLGVGMWLELAPQKEDANRLIEWLHKWSQQAQIWFNALPYLQRRFVLLALVLCLGLLVIASVALARPIPPTQLCPPNKVCILVAKFEPEGDKIATDFAAQMITDTRILLDKTETQNFVVLGAPVVRTPEEARQMARQANALLVVWGQVLTEPGETKPRVTVYFQLADLLGVGEAQGTRPYRAEPLVYDPIGEYCPNCIHLEAAQRTNIVAQAVAGLVHYAQGRPEQARLDFMAALYCAGELLDKAMIAIIQPTCDAKTPVAGWNPGLLYYYMGKALVLQGDYAGAIGFLQQANVHNDQDPAAWIGIATAYQSWLHQPNPPEAIQALRHAEMLGQTLLGKVPLPMQPVVHYDLGLIYELLKDFPRAQQHYQEAANRFTNAGASAYASLIGLARVQAHEDAIQTLEQARTLDANLPWAYLDLARLQSKTQWKAKELLQRAEQVAPDEAYVDITRAELCQQWKDYTCAATAYAQALKKRPDSGWLHSKIGEFYLPTNPVLSHQSWIEAARYFRRAATELRPQDPWAHERLAYVLFNQAAYDESIKEYQRTLELVHNKGEAAEIYCSLGHAQQRNNLDAAANESYERYAKLASTDEHGRAQKNCLKN